MTSLNLCVHFFGTAVWFVLYAQCLSVWSYHPQFSPSFYPSRRASPRVPSAYSRQQGPILGEEEPCSWAWWHQVQLWSQEGLGRLGWWTLSRPELCTPGLLQALQSEWHSPGPSPTSSSFPLSGLLQRASELQGCECELSGGCGSLLISNKSLTTFPC